MKATNCRTGSAWHSWQIAGYEWRAENPDAAEPEIEQAATEFAAEPGWPPIAKIHRQRAFIQGANAH